MKTRLWGGLAALVVAVIGTVLLLIYVNGADRRAMAGTETVDVYVVQKVIPKGVPVSELGQSVAKKPVPKTVLAPDSVQNLNDLSTKFTAVQLEPGEQLLSSRLVDPKDLSGPQRVTVPAGLQELTLRLPIERVVGGALSAQDTVGVILSFAKEDNTPAQTQQRFHKVMVTAVQTASGSNASDTSQQTATQQKSGGALGSASSGGGTDYLITLAVSPDQTDRIVLATEYGKVYLSKEPTTTGENNSGAMDRGRVFR